MPPDTSWHHSAIASPRGRPLLFQRRSFQTSCIAHGDTAPRWRPLSTCSLPTSLQVVEGPRGLCAVEVDFQGETQVFPMEKVAAMMMLELKKIAEADQGSAITDCVLSCPVYATETERAAMLDAARIAGLVPLRIVNENTATALGYGIYKTDLPQDDPVNVAIVDYGHTGIQVAIVALTRQGLRVLAHSWDTSCGGKDLDWALFEMVRAEFKSKTGLDLMENRRSTLRTLLAVEKCKKVRHSSERMGVAWLTPLPIRVHIGTPRPWSGHALHATIACLQRACTLPLRYSSLSQMTADHGR